MVTSSVSCFGFRISDGTVFTKNGGFRLFLGQPNEFPIMQVTHFWGHLKGKNNKKCSGPTHSSVSWKRAHGGIERDPHQHCNKPWPLEIGRWMEKKGTHFLSTLAGLMQMKNLEPDKRGCRFSWESDSLTFYSRYFWFYIQRKILQQLSYKYIFACHS